MINKEVKTVRVFILVSLALLHISVIMYPLQGQMNTPLSEEFSVPVTSDPNDFISVWNTTKISASSSGSSQVQLPLNSDGQYNFTVYWDDGSNDTITNWDQTENTHTYASEGVYTITITGKIVGWRFGSDRDRLKLLEIRQWGCLQLGNLANYFSGCENLELVATDYLNLTGTISLHGAFFGCTNLGSNGDMNGWDTSSVISMVDMFRGASSFNQPIGDWDVSSVTSMDDMFHGASSFNQPIGNWNVSNVLDMTGVFGYASSFNQPIGNWDVSSATMMSFMFDKAFSFNQDIGGWNVSNVIDMTAMFQGVRLSTHNYDSLLIGWSQLTLQTGVRFDGGYSRYSSGAAEDARAYIISAFNWTISDSGLDSFIFGYDIPNMIGIGIFSVLIAIFIVKKRSRIQR